MKIHCLYRDFFIFLKASEMEGDKWGAFKRYYFEKHKDFLSTLWFDFQGYTLKNIRERVKSIKRGDYSDLESAIRVYDLEGKTKEIINRCRSIMYIANICNVYLFVGFFSPDAFVIPYRDLYVIAIGLERFHNFSNYPLLLSHEYCHFVQNNIIGDLNRDKASIVERLVREGIAVIFTIKAYPGRTPWEYLFMDRKRYNLLLEMDADPVNILSRVLNSSRNQKEIDMFHFTDFYDHQNGRKTDIPPRIGYYLGYRLVENEVKGEEFDLLELNKSIKEIANRIEQKIRKF